MARDCKLNQVFDTWFTSSSSPYVCRESERLERSKGEYDDRLKNTTALRPQAHEIIRTWTFSTMLKTYLMALIDNNLFEERAKNRNRIADWLEKDKGEQFIVEKLIPWKDVMLSGWCLAKDGAKMSKSAGNVITPTSLIQEKGSDIVRYWAGSCSLGVDTAFNETKFADGKKLVNKILNATKFAVMHFERQNLQSKPLAECLKLVDKTADKWIISRLVEVVRQYRKAFDEFEYSVAKNAAERLFWDEYCDNYLEIVKNRAYADDLSALATLRIMTEAFLLLFAPYVSHLTSAVYREVFNAEVHRCGSFAALFAIDFADKQALADMKTGLEIINFVRQKKAEMQVSIKVPIKKLVVPAMPKTIEEDIKAMLSVESVEVGSELMVEI
jgi:valyl-tRNA synthetase